MVKDNIVETEVTKKVNISPYSKLKVYWDDQPHNYSREAKNKVRNYFANKYGVSKNNINVIFRPVKFNEVGDAIEINGAGIENIMDIEYQRSLMAEIIKRDGKVVDFDRIIALDDKVNSTLDIDLTETQHRTWELKWLMVDNFLSFGPDNYLPFSKLKGLTVVNSIPANQGGKTTLTIDAIKFLLHGNTTKTDKNEQVFNTFTDKNELVVRGMIDLEGDEVIIERKMRRTAKKGGGWTVVNKLNYYTLLPDGEEELQNEEDAKTTTNKIRETIGSEKDFEMLVLANEKNLDDLIGLTTSESGKVLTRLIGLEVLELKEASVRTMYNEFARKKKSNEYDVITLTNDIEEHNEHITLGTTAETNLNTKLTETKEGIKALNDENDKLLNSKEKVDVTITELNPSKLDADIKTLISNGVAISEKVKVIEESIKTIGDIIFDEDEYHDLTKKLSTNTTSLGVKNAEVDRLTKSVEDLISGGICKTCNRKLDDVDNSEHIAKHEKDIKTLEKDIKSLEKTIKTINASITSLDTNKKLIDEKNKLELARDRHEVEMASLRNEIGGKKNDLKKYNLNLEAIELNKRLDGEVSNVKTKIQVLEFTKDETITKIEKIRNEIETNKANIITKTKLIETIKKEEEVDRIYKIYIDLVGKKGISKLVLRSVLPIINSEVERLLDDVCDFNVEIFIDDKNEVQFLLIKDDSSKNLKSGSGFEKTAASLVLRSVLGKVSTLPMPNFITFDEILGKVAPENIDKLKPLFDKLKDMYDIVFFITHNDLIKDWGDNVLTVVKTDNVSKIAVK